MDRLPQEARGISIASDDEVSLNPYSHHCLSLLAEGVVLRVFEFAPEAHAELRTRVGDLARLIRDDSPGEEKIDVVRALLREFEDYRDASSAAFREHIFRWRSLARKTLTELLRGAVSEPRAVQADRLLNRLATLSTPAELKCYEKDLENFLHPLVGNDNGEQEGVSLALGDLSTANHNPAGLPGGGCAMRLIESILSAGGGAFVATIQLCSLDIIQHRFGVEAMHDCVMATAAYLAACLDRQDTIYHWTDTSLLAILQGRGSAVVATAELQRIASEHRNIIIRIDERNVMVRVPLAVQVAPIERFHGGEVLSAASLSACAHPQDIAQDIAR